MQADAPRGLAVQLHAPEGPHPAVARSHKDIDSNPRVGFPAFGSTIGNERYVRAVPAGQVQTGGNRRRRRASRAPRPADLAT
jgi:hypothetical protein